eukprot:NODE_5299_length_673_cov_27.571429_g5136_i0.p1 GENE.NODE_5299_length_673_cov_27.571429_g5136_i0~~NODE_5299_length_673_cov_27.571429_g5136_i0.p1  ORF type:complete len:172 (+),score=52.81 NODE_5299_length_673_cov_27.571429_g5136_i0:55-570(+)
MQINLKWNLYTLRALGLVGLLMVSFTGFFCIFTCHLTNPKLWVLNLWLPVFSCLGLGFEIQAHRVGAKFGFLANWIGKALFYIFLGTLCLDSGLTGWIVGLCMIALGCLILAMRVCNPSMFQETTTEDPVKDAETAVHMAVKKSTEKHAKVTMKEYFSQPSSTQVPTQEIP